MPIMTITAPASTIDIATEIRSAQRDLNTAADLHRSGSVLLARQWAHQATERADGILADPTASVMQRRAAQRVITAAGRIA